MNEKQQYETPEITELEVNDFIVVAAASAD